MTVEEAADILGMKPREVLGVVEVDDGYAVQTHDGRWSSIVDGKFDGIYPGGYSPVPVKRAAATKK